MSLRPHWIQALMLLEERGPISRRRGSHGYWGPEDIELMACANTAALKALESRGLVVLSLHAEGRAEITEAGRRRLQPVSPEEPLQ